MKEIFVVESDKSVVGCFAINKENQAKMLYVFPNITGTKAAKILFEKATTYMLEKGFEKLEFEALESSKNFLLKMGAYIRDEETKKIFNSEFKIYNMYVPLN